ncbi:transposase [Streptomyces sp. NPDC090075]|uniref:transposase n=1 Tax=Streptomyces sp. NPDC090075 TaxID=3365937 RepID=UPI00381037C3
MAERLPDGNEQNLQQFVNQSTWDPVPVQRRIVERMLPLIRPAAWVIDDVSVPKDGQMSVAVAPQYCGALGKRARNSRHWNGRRTPAVGPSPGFRPRSRTARSGGWLWTCSTHWPAGA